MYKRTTSCAVILCSEVIFEEGAMGQKVYVLMAGCVQIHRVGAMHAETSSPGESLQYFSQTVHILAN